MRTTRRRSGFSRIETGEVREARRNLLRGFVAVVLKLGERCEVLFGITSCENCLFNFSKSTWMCISLEQISNNFESGHTLEIRNGLQNFLCVLFP